MRWELRDCRLCVHVGEVEDLALCSDKAVPCGWQPSPSAHLPPWATESRPEVEPETAERCLCYAPDPKKVLRP